MEAVECATPEWVDWFNVVGYWSRLVTCHPWSWKRRIIINGTSQPKRPDSNRRSPEYLGRFTWRAPNRPDRPKEVQR